VVPRRNARGGRGTAENLIAALRCCTGTPKTAALTGAWTEIGATL
jgi:hypothetical protein